jgi:hypothetical protein
MHEEKDMKDELLLDILGSEASGNDMPRAAARTTLSWKHDHSFPHATVDDNTICVLGVVQEYRLVYWHQAIQCMSADEWQSVTKRLRDVGSRGD